MRIFELPKKNTEASFQNILDIVEKSVSNWEKKAGKASAFGEGEMTAIVKKGKTEKNEAPQEPPAEDLEEFETPKSNTRIWVFGAICLAVIALGFFISYRISR
jgi:hypothetical protein